MRNLIEVLREMKVFDFFRFGLKNVKRKDYIQMIKRFEEGEYIMTYDCSYFNRVIEFAFILDLPEKGWFMSEMANVLIKRIEIIGNHNSVTVKRISYNKNLAWKHYIILMKINIERSVSRKDFERFIDEIFDIKSYKKDLKRYLKFEKSYSSGEEII